MARSLLNVVFGVVLSAIATTAFAQPPAQPASPAPLVVEQIQNGWVFVPDARIADLGDQTGALAGGYIGHLTDRTWVFGGGGYYLTNRDDDFKLAYGGPVFEWLVRADRRIGFGVRGLVGVGSATLPQTISDYFGGRVPSRPTARHDGRDSFTALDPNATVAVHDDFVIAEPQLNVMWNLSPGQRLVFGVGYRAVGAAPRHGGELNGVSGSISFQIGGK
jgi:hypothetical protein